MKFKHLIITILALLSYGTTYAQETTNDTIIIANEDSCDTREIEPAITACLMLAQSAESGDTVAIRNAKKALQACNLGDFVLLRPKDQDEIPSLQGHLVFDVAFADSLAEGKDAYREADNIYRESLNRGQTRSRKIVTKTVFVKARGTAAYTFKSWGRQELAIVAEPKGLISTRIHATNKQHGFDEWHNDTKDINKGRNNRKAAFNLPQKPLSQVVLEITNCTNRDISVVVISN